MFRKLVSALPFSPAMVGQLGFYARRLQREQFIRRLGLLFAAMAITVQSLILFRPPEPTVASSPTSECQFNTDLSKNDPSCRSCPYNTNLWIYDKGCNAHLRLELNATNLSTAQSATKTSAHAEDRIQYNLKTTNIGHSKITTPLTISVSDLVEYGTVIDQGGGVFDADAQKVSWGEATLHPGEVDVRSFVLQLNGTLPATPQASDNPLSYDCALTDTYGSTVSIRLACPTSKIIETTIRHLPSFTPLVVMIFAATSLCGIVYFYLRARLLARELKIIRKDFNGGPM